MLKRAGAVERAAVRRQGGEGRAWLRDGEAGKVADVRASVLQQPVMLAVAPPLR